MTFKYFQCFAVAFLSSSVIFSTLSISHAATPLPPHDEIVRQVQDHWAKLEERRSFNDLSEQNLQALNAILDADELLSQHRHKEAATKLSFARDRLNSALQAHHNLAQSAAYVEKLHRVNPAFQWLPQYNAANWAPVGGKFIAKTDLSKTEHKALSEANSHLRLGKVDEAYKIIGFFRNKTQISIAIAPLEPTIEAVETALATLQRHDASSAQAVLQNAMTHYVFIPQDALSVDLLVHKNQNRALLARR
ncbi:YfdX family protein [Acetobacteraceae bacterium ESL0709]|nr:YfdX family protein [Acetobacteraceae bacterium ESL0697]MDF7678766.1 YfdX family protein [Acetobacteraceae bacterium ESL0709]